MQRRRDMRAAQADYGADRPVPMAVLVSVMAGAEIGTALFWHVLRLLLLDSKVRNMQQWLDRDSCLAVGLSPGADTQADIALHLLCEVPAACASPSSKYRSSARKARASQPPAECASSVTCSAPRLCVDGRLPPRSPSASEVALWDCTTGRVDGRSPI